MMSCIRYGMYVDFMMYFFFSVQPTYIAIVAYCVVEVKCYHMVKAVIVSSMAPFCSGICFKASQGRTSYHKNFIPPTAEQ